MSPRRTTVTQDVRDRTGRLLGVVWSTLGRDDEEEWWWAARDVGPAAGSAKNRRDAVKKVRNRHRRGK